jgi:hypothetical protein
MVVIALLNRMPVLDSGKSNTFRLLTSLGYASNMVRIWSLMDIKDYPKPKRENRTSGVI